MNHSININSNSRNPFKSLQEIFLYKYLLYMLVKRDVTIIYKQTILGFSWAIIRPLFSMVVFSLVFGELAKIPSDGVPYPIFSYSALVPWLYFSTSLVKSSNSLVSNKNIFTKVYFPRIIFPITPVIAGLVDYLISLSIVFVLMFYYSMSLSMNIVFIPFLTFIMFLTASGVGMFFSALAVQYRDVIYATQFFVQLLMYAAPVVWPFSIFVTKFGESLSLVYALFPMVGVIEGSRAALLGTNQIPWDLMFVSFLGSIIIFFLGFTFFLKKEDDFADVV